jgi:hypothetical protein
MAICSEDQATQVPRLTLKAEPRDSRPNKVPATGLRLRSALKVCELSEAETHFTGI